jgi:starch-binding outer membrane protein, SusD/RagB family
MKYLIEIFKFVSAGVLALMLTTSCENFLEQPVDAITTIDSVFTNPDNAMMAFFNAYSVSLSWNHGLRHEDNTSGYPPLGANRGFGNAGNDMMYTWSDEATREICNWGNSQTCKRGTWGPQDQRDFPIVGVVNAIRACNIFLENADKVPNMTTSQWDWNEDFKNQLKAEVRFLRAFLHFEIFRRYGGIPILDRLSTFSQKPGGGIIVDPSGERRSIASVINFISSECDLALPNLPNSYSSAEKGRVTKGAAHALKAKALLYAASPLYNTATPPVPYGDERDSLLCYGNTDPNRWQLAADAYLASITWAEANGYELMDDPGLGKRESYLRGTISPRSQTPLNRESILFTMPHSTRAGAPQYYRPEYYRTVSPLYYGVNWSRGGIGVRFVRENFRDVNGITLNIPDEGNFPALKNILRNAEPRFHASVWVPGQQYTHSSEALMITNGGHDTAKFSYRTAAGAVRLAQTSSATWAGEQTGFFWPKKWQVYGHQADNFINWSEFRLSELYLGYAEALNEINPTHADILTYMNKVRLRGGIPLLAPGDPTYDANFGDQAKMRKEIWRERGVEHFAEEHRWFDIRRWRIAENVMGGEWKMIVLYENENGTYVNPLASWTPAQRAANDEKLSYRFIKYSDHVWDNKMYFYPWYQNEVNKGIIIQNPGW